MKCFNTEIKLVRVNHPTFKIKSILLFVCACSLLSRVISLKISLRHSWCQYGLAVDQRPFSASSLSISYLLFLCFKRSNLRICGIYFSVIDDALLANTCQDGPENIDAQAMAFVTGQSSFLSELIHLHYSWNQCRMAVVKHLSVLHSSATVHPRSATF